MTSPDPLAAARRMAEDLAAFYAQPGTLDEDALGLARIALAAIDFLEADEAYPKSWSDEAWRRMGDAHNALRAACAEAGKEQRADPR